MNSRLQIPNKNNLFYSDEDFDIETEWLEGYIEEDLNQTVVLYQVDRKRTNTDEIYKETKRDDVRYLPPREIPCMYEIKDAELKSFDSKSANGVYAQGGNLLMNVLVRTLEKYGVDIKRGDYIGIHIDNDRMKYYTVVNDGKVNTANTLMVGGYKPAWRQIEATVVSDITEFNG